MKNLKNLDEIKKYVEELGGQWNGEDFGVGEERTQITSDILEKVVEIEILLEELDNL